MRGRLRPMDPVPSFVAECFWPGVSRGDLDALDRRVERSTARLADSGMNVRSLGSLLMDVDEVVLCLFEGTEDSVRLAADEARVPYARNLGVGRTGTSA